MPSVANYNIEDNSGANVRIDLNAVFSAIQSNNSESSDLATSKCVAGMTFLNTTTNILKIRNSTNGGFTDIGNIDTANLGLLPRSGGSTAPMTGQLLLDDSNSAGTPALSFDTDANLGLFRKSSDVMGFSSAGIEQLVFDANGITLRTQNEIRFSDNDSSHYVGLRAASTVGTSFTLTLPTGDGSNGQVIKTDGSGNLSFTSITGSLTVGTTAIALGSSATTIAGLSSLTSTTLQSTTFKTNATSRVAPAFQNSSGTEIGRLCNTYVNFNGQGTVAIRDDLNVSSITDIGTGHYQVNFTTAMADVNYTTVVTGDLRSPNTRYTGTDCNNYTTSSLQITVEDNSQYGASRADVKLACVAIFGNT